MFLVDDATNKAQGIARAAIGLSWFLTDGLRILTGSAGGRGQVACAREMA
jgi:hypothetical protein